MLLYKENKKDTLSLLKLNLLTIATIPILPNIIKGLPIIILLIVALTFFFTKKKAVFNWKLFLINSIIYTVYIVSLLHTSNYEYAFKKLETGLSLLIITVIFSLLWSFKRKIIDDLFLRKFTLIFFISTIIYSSCVFLFLLYKGLIKYFQDPNFVRHFTQVIPLIGQHSIYASIYLAIGLIFSFYLIRTSNKAKTKLIIITVSFPIFLLLIFLASKGVLVAFLISIIIFIIFEIKNSKKRIILITSIFGLLILGVVFSPSLSSRIKRFNTSLKITSYNAKLNSTQIRKAVYDCSINLMEENWIIGYGVGDVKDVLMQCYQEKSSILVNGKFNTHNQYFSIILASGLIGLVLTLFFLGYNFKIAMVQKNYLFISILIFYAIVMLIENILERQSGVILFAFLVNFLHFTSKLQKI